MSSMGKDANLKEILICRQRSLKFDTWPVGETHPFPHSICFERLRSIVPKSARHKKVQNKQQQKSKIGEKQLDIGCDRRRGYSPKCEPTNIGIQELQSLKQTSMYPLKKECKGRKQI